jgi:hypothetical protein
MTALDGNSPDPVVPGVSGENGSSRGFLAGLDPLFNGAVGVFGESAQNGVFGRTASSVPQDHAVYGQNDGAGHGVTGVSTSTGSSGFLAGADPIFNQHAGVYGQSDQQGVIGRALSTAGTGVHGSGPGSAFGVRGETETGIGVSGSSSFGVGVKGISTNAEGGIGDSGVGVVGEGLSNGVVGRASNGVGVQAESKVGSAIIALTRGGDAPVLILDQFGGTGDLIFAQVVSEGQPQREVFRVTLNGDVQSRGITLTSDRNAKTNFSSVNTLEILESLTSIPINKWNYKADPSGVQHVGPTSQDFQGAFGLNGDDDVHISMIDAQGVALAAIQGLNDKLKAENTQLRADFASLEIRIAALESNLSEAKSAPSRA